MEPFLNFFKTIAESKDYDLRFNAAYNLPCIYTMFRLQAKDQDLQEYYHAFLAEESVAMRKVVAAHIHVAFEKTTHEEQIYKLREAFKKLLEEKERDIIVALAENIAITLKHYLNDQAVNNFAQSSQNGKTNSQEITPQSNSGSHSQK